MDTNIIYNIDALDLLKALPDASIDLILTSPPYDDLRKYNGYSWNFEAIAQDSYRVLKQGGVLVWVVGDSVIDGSESLTSFKQALYFKEQVGFRMHDTMIYSKDGAAYPSSNRYNQVFEYMFVLSKGTPNTFNPIMTPARWAGSKRFGRQSSRNTEGELIKRQLPPINTMKPLDNIWQINNGYGYSSSDNNAYEHPAMFPEKLAERHILTWSNPGDIVLDYFAGSGTTLKMARNNNRRYIGCDISAEYVELCNKRLSMPFTPRMFSDDVPTDQASQSSCGTTDKDQLGFEFDSLPQRSENPGKA